jgi:hypothetical protein
MFQRSAAYLLDIDVMKNYKKKVLRRLRERMYSKNRKFIRKNIIEFLDNLSLKERLKLLLKSKFYEVKL